MTKRTMALPLAAVLILAGCTKDGKYSPAEKISHVYAKSTYMVEHLEGEEWLADTSITVKKHLTEQWFWDGKKLAAIAYYDGTGHVERTVKFEYDGSQLTKAASDANNYMEIAYDGRKVATAKTYSGGVHSGTYTFSHDGSQINQIDIRYPSSTAVGAKLRQEPCYMEDLLWQMVLPCDVRAGLPSPLMAGNSKAAVSISVKLTWDGKNISAAELTSGGAKYTIAYTYDDKKNPYQGFLYALVGGGDATPLSRNNVLTETHTDAQGGREAVSYAYAYQGNWPIARSTGYKVGTDTHRRSTTETLYFEYAE